MNEEEAVVADMDAAANPSPESLGSLNRRTGRLSRLPQHLAAAAVVALKCSLGRDILNFGKAGEDAATKVIRQILDTEALIPTRKPK